MLKTEKETEREGSGGRGRRGVAGPSFMLNKAMMGDRLGTTSQAETGLLPFVPRESLRREWREGGGKDGVSTICLLREKVCRSVCAVEDVSVCVFAWSRRDINRRGGVGPSLSRCLFCLQKQTPLNQLCSATKRQKTTTRVNKEPPSCLQMDSNPLSPW